MKKNKLNTAVLLALSSLWRSLPKPQRGYMRLRKTPLIKKTGFKKSAHKRNKKTGY